MRGRTLAFFLAFVALAPRGAHAQPEDVEERRKELFAHGTALAEYGRWQEAADKFREVIALRSAPKALIALGVAEEHLGRLLSARRSYKQADSDATVAEDRERAARALEAVNAKIPRLVLHLPAGAPVVTSLLDDHRVEGSQTEIELDPGPHQLVVQSSGFLPFQASVALVEGQRLELDVELEKPVKKTRPEERTWAPPIGAAVVGGAGLVITGTAFGLWIAGRSAESDVRKHCPQGGVLNDCPLSQKPAADAAASKIVVGDVLMPIGVAAIAAATVWWVVVSVRSNRSPSGWTPLGGRF